MFDPNYLTAPGLWDFIGNQVKNGFAEYSLFGAFWIFILNLSRINAKKKLAIEHAREVAERQKELEQLERQKEALTDSIKDALREQISTLENDVARLKKQSLNDRKAFGQMKGVALRLATQLAKMRDWIVTLERNIAESEIKVPKRDFDLDAFLTIDEINEIPVRPESDGEEEAAV